MALCSGRFPSRDPNGDPYPIGSKDAERAGKFIAGGLFCTVWRLGADAEWLANGLNLEHFGGLNMCCWCCANVGDDEDDQRFAAFGLPHAPWNDIGPRAGWRPTRWISSEAWRNYHGGFSRLHPLFALPAFSILNIFPDTMHCWCLGITHHLLGNVFWELCYTNRYLPEFPTSAQRCAEVWNRITRQYALKQTPDQISTLEPRFFINPDRPHQDYPALTSRIRAAESRVANKEELQVAGAQHFLQSP